MIMIPRISDVSFLLKEA